MSLLLESEMDAVAATLPAVTSTSAPIVQRSTLLCNQMHGRRKRNMKLRSTNRGNQVLQVKDCDASLRLATDLPRFNWLELKLNQYGNSVSVDQLSKCVKRDARHKFLAQLTAEKSSSNEKPQDRSEGTCDVTISVSCDTKTLVETNDSCSSSKETTGVLQNSETLHRWPLKKRIIKTEANLIALRNSTNEEHKTVEIQTNIQERQPSISLAVGPNPDQGRAPEAPAELSVVRTQQGHQDQPLDLSKIADDTSVPAPPAPKRPCLKVIPDAKIHLMLANEPPESPRLPEAAKPTSCSEYRYPLIRPAQFIPVQMRQQRIAVGHNHAKQTTPLVPNHLQHNFGPKLHWNFMCSMCGKKAGFRCAECKKSSYCSVLCQAMDWSRHSTLCRLSRANR